MARCLVFLSCLKSFSPPRCKERKGRQEIRTYLVLFSVLCVFAVQILGFGVFQGRLISDEGMSTTVVTHPALKDMSVRVSTSLDGSAFSLMLVFLDSLFSQRITEMGKKWFFPGKANHLIGWIKSVPEQLIPASSTSSLIVQGNQAPEFAEGPHLRHAQIWSLSLSKWLALCVLVTFAAPPLSTSRMRSSILILFFTARFTITNSSFACDGIY